jgi:hypothetical protein
MHMDTAVAVANACLANLLDPSFERGLPGSSGFVVVGRRIEPQDLAGSSDRYAPIHQHSVDQLALAGRP